MKHLKELIRNYLLHEGKKHFNGPNLEILLIDGMAEHIPPTNKGVIFDSNIFDVIYGEGRAQDKQAQLLHDILNQPLQAIVASNIETDDDPVYYYVFRQYFFAQGGTHEQYVDSIIDQLMDWLTSFKSQVEDAFISAGGDDDTYDYVPFFIWLYEDLLRKLGAGEYVKQSRKSLFNLDPEYPEFFTDEEIEEFSKTS